MDMPISRAAAYVKRNRTTHSWYGDHSGADLMSRSCPARTLEDHMRQARSAVAGLGSSPRRRASGLNPIMIRPSASSRPTTGFPTSSSSSPGHTSSAAKSKHLQQERPSSAYSYDGGFFVTANNDNKDFFVINPEWVSEGETVKKLGTDAKEGAGNIASSRKPRKVQISWKSYRRSKSAPPTKHRNPITWS